MGTPCEICATEERTTLLTGTDRQHGVPGSWCLTTCRGCGLVQMDPIPTTEEIGRFYPEAEYYAHRPSAGTFRDVRVSRFKRFVLRHGYGYPPRVRRNIISTLAGRLAGLFVSPKHLVPWVGDGKLLDVGCGVGSALWRMRAMGWQVQGVEPNARAAAIGQEQGLKIFAGTLDQARFPDASFDLVRLSHVLEHTPSPLATLVEVRRILKPQGRLLLAVPNIASFMFRRFGSDWFPLELPRHLFHFSPATLRALCQRAGLELYRVRYASSAEMLLRSWQYRREVQARARHRELRGPPLNQRRWLKKLLTPPVRVADLCRTGEIMECTCLPADPKP